jgi:hypothetical protein
VPGARRRLTPSDSRRIEIFSSMPMEETPAGVTVGANTFAWTRARFGPPRITKGADMVGTSLVETGVVDDGRYLEAVRALAGTHGATRYFAHRRESTDKLHRLAVETGLEIVRPELPLELIARRGPIGRTILSFPSTVVHTLPLALSGTEVRVAVCDIDPAWRGDGRGDPADRGSHAAAWYPLTWEDAGGEGCGSGRTGGTRRSEPSRAETLRGQAERAFL